LDDAREPLTPEKSRGSTIACDAKLKLEGLSSDRAIRTTTIVKEREPADRTTVIKREHDDGVESKTVIHHDD
jgi:hypothetical protein